MKSLKNKLLLLISVIAVIGFIYISISNFHEPPENFNPGFISGNYRPVPLFNLFLSPLFLILAIVPFSYYMLSRKIEENMKLIAGLVNKSGQHSRINEKSSSISNKNMILKFLNSNERIIVERLLEKNGLLFQSDISRIPGMTKLKTHRAVKDLVRKGIINTENYGKTKRIILSKDIRKIW